MEDRLINIELTGKTALVCGASKGIGRATAFQLAQQGANVVLLARSKDILVRMVKELPGSGSHHFLAVDISHRDLLKFSVESFIDKHGPIHILVNNSGGPKGGPITDASSEEFLNAFQNHLLVNSLLTQLLLPGMKKSSYGRIINIISTSVKVPIQNLGVSNTIRAAVANWAKTLSLEVATLGITVNNVLPGYTSTEILIELIEYAAIKTGRSIAQIDN